MEAFDSWWVDHQGRIVDLSESADLMKVRAEFLETFAKVLVPVGLLDRFKVSGVIARWWGEAQFDLKTLKARGFEGVVQGWVTTITTALEDEKARGDALDHKLVKLLLPEFLEEIAAAEADVAELDGTIKGAQATDEGDDETEAEEGPSEAELRALKKKLTAAKKGLKGVRATFIERLTGAAGGLSSEQARRLVLDILKADLRQELDRYLAAHRREIVRVAEGWWEKYAESLRSIEAGQAETRAKLKRFLTNLGYEA